MKSDTERKIRYQSKMHKKKDFLNIHVSKDLRSKMKSKKRSMLVHKGDNVKVMRGFAKGKTGKIANVDYNKSRVYVEGITKRTARGKEILVSLEPSNVMLMEAEMTKERKELFSETKEKPAEKTEKVKVDNAKVVSEVKS